jgi:hypothetical protein
MNVIQDYVEKNFIGEIIGEYNIRKLCIHLCYKFYFIWTLQGHPLK